MPRGTVMVHAYFICAFHALISLLLVNLSVEKPQQGRRWLAFAELGGALLLFSAAIHRFLMWGDTWLLVGLLLVAPIHYFRRLVAARLVALMLLCVPFYLTTHLHLHLISAQYSIMALSVLCFSSVTYLLNSFSLRRSGVRLVPISIEGLRLDLERAWPVLTFCAMASLVSGFFIQPNLASSLLLLFFIGLMAVANRLDDKLRMGLLLLGVFGLWGLHAVF